MKSNTLTSATQHLRKGFIVVILIIGMVPLMTAQSFNSFQQNPADNSDWFINLNWSINTSGSCDCIPFSGSIHYIHAYDIYFGTDDIVSTVTGQTANPWTGSNTYTLPPGYSQTFYGEYNNTSATNDLPPTATCLLNCPFSAFSPNTVLSAQPLKNAQNIVLARADNGSAHITWNVATDIPEYSYELRILKNNVLVETIYSKSTVEWFDACPVIGDTYSLTTYFFDGFNLSNSQTAPASVTMTSGIYNSNLPNGTISGNVKTVSCQGETGVTVRATLTNPGSIDNGSCWPSVLYATTAGTNGSFTFNNLYYGTGSDQAIYEIEALLTDHQFRRFTIQTTTCQYSADSIIYTAVLSSGDHDDPEAKFIDITSYVISGQVLSSGAGFNSCGLEGVTIREAPPGNNFPMTTTDDDGNWSVVVPEGNTSYQLLAQYDAGSIADSIMTIAVVDQDVPGVVFTHTAKDTLRGFVGSGCEEFIGQATLNVRSLTNPCVIKDIITNSSGYYEVVLPSRPFIIEVTGIDLTAASGLMDEGVVLTGFGGPDTLFMFDTTTTRNFVYHRPLTMSLRGMPATACAAIPHPILEKGQIYGVYLDVTESEGCPVDSGYIVITDEVSGTALEATIYDTVFISQGNAFYPFVPGDPNFFGDHQKSITFIAHAGTEVVPLTTHAIVVGSKQTGTNFLTSAPTDLPLLILRDPPGDLSYSQFESGSTTSIGQTFSTLVGGSVKAWAKVKAGTDIFGLSIYGEIGGSLEIGGTNSNTKEFVFDLTNTQTFSTSNNMTVIGTSGDLFLGASYNFIYSKAAVLDFDVNTCSLMNDTTLMISPDSFATTFIYTESWIRGEGNQGVIPQLRATANSESQPDSVRYRALNSIKLWEQVLQYNEDLKEEALMNGTNYSFDGALGEFGEDVVATKTEKRTLEFVTQIDIGLSAELGLEFNNNGFTAGVDVAIRTEIGEVETQSTTTTTTTRYRIDDDNSGDAFSIDIATDPVYATPVFKLVAGQSSCPHEEPTARRDEIALHAVSPVAIVDDPDGTAFFTLEIINTSHTGETRPYRIGYNSLSGNGAVVMLEGNPANQDIFLPAIAPGIQDYQVTINRQMGSPQYQFENIEFYIYPACYSEVSSADQVGRTYLSAYFESPCSNIDMSAPVDTWLINESSGNQMLVTMSGYDLENDFDQVIMQYSIVGSTSWQVSNVVKSKAELLVGSTTVPWDVTNVADGEYSIRFRLNCGQTYSFSNRISGVLDRTPPVVYGAEKPTSDVFTAGSKISVEFNEDVDYAGLTPGQYYLMSVPDSVYFDITLVGSGNEIELIPSVDISGLYNTGFEVGLIHLKDLYNNQRPDTVKWEFIIGEPDADNDGVPDTKDRCPGGDDYADSDLDGLPDDCDCMPTVASNGRLLTKAALDFDGVDDQIVVPHHTDLNPGSDVSFTFEAWVKPDSGTISQTILSKGAGGNGNTSYIFALYQNKIALFIGGGGATSTWLYSDTDVTFNQWMHAAVSYDHTTGKFSFFLNGNFDGERTLTHGFYSNSSPLYIARQGEFCNCNFFKGRMDEVRFWNTARTPGDILENMHQELPGDESGLVAYYPFNEGTPFGDNTDLTFVEDHSGNGHTGTVQGFTKNGTVSNWVNSTTENLDIGYALCKTCPDTVNAAMRFDGVDDKILLANDPALVPTTASSMTFETWVYPTQAYPDVIVSCTDNLYLALSSFGNIQIFTQSFAVTAAVIPQNTWTHLAFVFKPDSVKCYINGELNLSGVMTHNPVNAGNQISLGGIATNNDFLLDGKLDDVRFWNYARTQEEIINSIQQELAGNEPGLVVYYNFNQGIPGGDNTGLNTVEDVTGNGHTGTLDGFAQTGIVSNWVTSPFNFPDGDKDGWPDVCDDCFAYKILTLQGQLLDQSVYRAEEEIILGPGLTFPAFPEIDFKAPEVRAIAPVDFNSGIIRIYPNGCDD